MELASMSKQSEPSYLQLQQHYEKCFVNHGDTPKGADWPNEQEAITRYQVMYELIRQPALSDSVLDFGCGAALFLDYLKKADLYNFNY